MENMSIYEQARSVPQDAQKRIAAGRLKDFTDINPMWRIKKLTEMFGPCGIGWYYEIADKWCDAGADGVVACNVIVNLYIKFDGEWSKAIQGIGGNQLVANEKSGLRTSDEAYKMALTDALSVACKALGVGADIYWSADATKYTKSAQNGSIPDETATAVNYACAECGKAFEAFTSAKSGKTFTAGQAFEIAKKNNCDGVARCRACMTKLGTEVKKGE